LDIGKVTGKYMELGDEDGEGKTHPHPAPLPCLASLKVQRALSDVLQFVHKKDTHFDHKT